MGKKIWDVAEGMEDEKEREKFIEEEVKKYWRMGARYYRRILRIWRKEWEEKNKKKF